MSYIGVQPTAGQYRKLDDISASFNGSTTSFTTSVGGTNVTAGTAPQLLVSVGGVIQKPDSDYTVSTNTITFTTAPATGLDFFAVLMGDALNTVSTSDGSITTAKLAGSLSVGLAAGTNSAPSLYFTGDSNTGVYSPGADQVAVTTGGTQRLLFDAAGQIEAVSLGTASAPTYSFTTDPNTGVYSPGADQLAITTGGTGRLFVDSSGRVGLGTSNPGGLFHISGTFGTTLTTGLRVDGLGTTTNNVAPIAFYTQSSNWGTIHAANIACGNSSGTNGGGYLRFSTSPDGNTAPVERIRVTEGGLVGIGTTSPKSILTANGNIVGLNAGTHSWQHYQQASSSYTVTSIDSVISGASGSLVFKTGTNWTNADAIEQARIDSNGRLLVGTSSSPSAIPGQYAKLVIQGYTGDAGGAGEFSIQRGQAAASIASGADIGSIRFNDSAGYSFAGISCYADAAPGASDYPGRLVFSTTADGASSPTEAMRITQSGSVLIQTTQLTSTVDGCYFNSTTNTEFHQLLCHSSSSSGLANLYINRQASDGALIEFRQADTAEGSISVSGTTVTYGGGHLARWSQLPNDEDPSGILKGTVMSNLDEMCEWGDEDNEQLNKTKVSNIEGDPNVAGLFVSTSFSEDGPLDFWLAMTGDMIIRIAEGVTVQRGDLLMSAGDGTAKPQDDDIIRSKTVAKVTSTHVTCTYDDGSYCVPCVLMAC